MQRAVTTAGIIIGLIAGLIFTAIPASSAIRLTPLEAKHYAHHRVHAAGWGSRSHAQQHCLVRLWNRESGWRYWADNPTSSAYGIPQAMTSIHFRTRAARARYMTDATYQVRWGLRYIRTRYGTPCAALAHSYRYSWY